MVSGRLVLASPRYQPHVEESGFISANHVEFIHDPLYCPHIRLSSVEVVASTLIDAVFHDSIMNVEVLICLPALVRSIVENPEVVPECVIVLPLSRMSRQF